MARDIPVAENMDLSNDAMAAAAEAAKADVGGESDGPLGDVKVLDEEDEGALEKVEGTADVEDSDFWDTEGVDFGEDADGEEETPDAEDSETPQADAVGTLVYKANGKEVSVDLGDPKQLAETVKKLELVDGARKAFNDKAKLRQSLKKKDGEIKELESYKASWDKLEDIKDDPHQLWEAITGEKYSEMIAREVEKSGLYASASEEERKIMDYEERFQRMERQAERDRAKRIAEEEAAEARQYAAEKAETHAKFRTELEKYEIGTEETDPAQVNRMRKMLYRNAVADIQDYVKEGYKFSDKMIRKAFRDNAKALQSFYKTSVTKGVKEVVGAKKEKAKEKAAEAATSKYKQGFSKEVASKDPLDVFRSYFKAKR